MNLEDALRGRGLISTREACRMLNCSISYLNYLSRVKRADGKNPIPVAARVAGRRLWRVADVMAYKVTHPRLGTNRKAS